MHTINCTSKKEFVHALRTAPVGPPLVITWHTLRYTFPAIPPGEPATSSEKTRLPTVRGWKKANVHTTCDAAVHRREAYARKFSRT
jgi:hypothetical protein